MKLVIFGSCVTRDTVRVVGQDGLLTRYIARTSIVSVVSPPLPRAVTVTLASDFQTRMVRNDLYKDLNAPLKQPDVLILMDCIDERFDLLATEGTYITRSAEMVQAGVMEQLGGWTRVDRASAQGRALWSESCRTLKQSLHPTARVVLHRSFWAPEYLSNGEAQQFGGRLADDIARNNAYLEFCYGEVERHFSPVTVAADPRFFVASETHRWGLSPFHYVDEYYHDVWRAIATAVPEIGPTKLP